MFVEYVMLAKVNDNEEQAHQLGALLQGRAVVLNLIPWNPVYSPEFDFEAPGHQRTESFQTTVRQYGVHCTVRQEKGQDISGSCYMGHDFVCTAAIHTTCQTVVTGLQLLLGLYREFEATCRRLWTACGGVRCWQGLW